MKRPTNRLDLLNLVSDMREAGLPDPALDAGYQRLLRDASSCLEVLRWLEGYWAGHSEGRTSVLETLMDGTHVRRKNAYAEAVEEAERIVRGLS